MEKRGIARKTAILSLTAAMIICLFIQTGVTASAEDTGAPAEVREVAVAETGTPPSTGDSSHILTYIFVLLISVTVLAVVLLIVKKRKGNIK